MIDYTKMTKAELIEKLEEQKHLGKAVEAKDKEITGYIQRISELKESLRNTVSRETYEALNKEKQAIIDSYAGSVKKEALEGYTRALEQERDSALKIANNYILAYRDFLKLTKQNLNMAIFTEELLAEKIKTKE